MAPDSPADALRAAADLADLTADRVRPALQAGAVVVCEGFVDATIVAYRAAGVEEQRLARVAQWAVNGLKPDLTVLVDGVLRSAGAPTTERPTTDASASDSATTAAPQPEQDAPVPAAEPAADAVERRPEVVGGAPGDAVDAAAGPSAATRSNAALSNAALNAAPDKAPLDNAVLDNAVLDSAVLDSAALDNAVQDSAVLDSAALDNAAAPADHDAADHDADEDEPVDPVHAYRDRASYTPERYLIVRPLSEEPGRAMNPEVVERISSVLRQRSPSLAEPQPAG
jgi:dTMP kinase